MDSFNGKHSSVASGAGRASFNSPRRIRRRKDPTPFNVLVIGAKGSGKSSLIDFLKTSLMLPPEKQHNSMATPKIGSSDGSFTSHYIESEVDGERVGVTFWDSKGLEKNLVDLQIREMVTFIEARFEETFIEESKVNRAPGSRDTHIHCVLLVLDPSNLDANINASKSLVNGNAFAQARGPSGLSADLDLQVMKGLAGKTTVVPVISKADTLTSAHMEYLKRSVWSSIQTERLDPLEALGLEDEEDEEDDDSESQSDADPLPIQSTASGGSGDHKHSRFHDDSDHSDGPRGDSSPMAKTRSTMTTPSPGQAIKRPSSRAASRTLDPSEVSLEDMYIPFSLLSPDPYELNAVGRRFAWGLADPYNADHCDFGRLRESVFSEWRTELRSAAREKWYETWRTSRLANNSQRMRQTGGVTPTGAVPQVGRAGSSATQRSLSPAGNQVQGLGVFSSPNIRPATSAGRMVSGGRGGF